MTISRALAPSAVRDGAVVSYDGDRLVVSGDAIVATVASRLANPAANPARVDQFLMDGVPVFSRGEAWIIPLSWLPVPSDDETPERAVAVGVGT